MFYIFQGRSSLHLTHVTFSPNGEEILISYSGEHVYLMDVHRGLFLRAPSCFIIFILAVLLSNWLLRSYDPGVLICLIINVLIVLGIFIIWISRIS